MEVRTSSLQPIFVDNKPVNEKISTFEISEFKPNIVEITADTNGLELNLAKGIVFNISLAKGIIFVEIGLANGVTLEYCSRQTSAKIEPRTTGVMLRNQKQHWFSLIWRSEARSHLSRPMKCHFFANTTILRSA